MKRKMKTDSARKVGKLKLFLIKQQNHLVAFAFLAILAWISIANILPSGELLRNLLRPSAKFQMPDKGLIRQVENSYDDKIAVRPFFLRFNALFHKMTLRRLMNQVVKTRSASLLGLYELLTEIPWQKQQEAMNSIKELHQFCKDEDISFVFVLCNNKADALAGELPLSFYHLGGEKQAAWLRMLDEEGCDYLDLRTLEGANDFYRSDHHWTAASALKAGEEILRYLQDKSDLCRNEFQLLERRFFEEKILPKSFLGSEGIKTSDAFVGKDDFSYFLPLYPTQFNYQHYLHGERNGQHEGDFSESFIDESLLSDSRYLNKYNAFLYAGYCENIIQNAEAPNDKKLLLVTDSFGRVLAPYLSIGFKETRYLDPQKGRFEESIRAYAQKNKPDILIVMITEVLP